MGGMMIEKLLPEGLQEIYRSVYTSIDNVEDERVKIALTSVLYAIHKDTANLHRRELGGSNVIPFPGSEFY